MAQMTATDFARQMGGKPCGPGEYLTHCLVNGHGKGRGDLNPSLSVRDGQNGQLIFHCFAGCDWRDVRDAAIARGWLDGCCPRTMNRRSRWAAKRLPAPAKLAESAKRDLALKIYALSQPIAGTLAETYLASRGLRPVASTGLRFHPYLKHPDGEYWPGLIALVTHGADETPQAIHRTFLARDGQGKAPVEPQRMMLGPVRGGCVRLAPAAEHILVGEGIETCLAAMLATGHPAWAALSTSGLRILDLPKEVRDLIVLADGDDAGEAAARDCALRWSREGRRVRIARPPRGMDFNDLLMGSVPRFEGRAQ